MGFFTPNAPAYYQYSNQILHNTKEYRVLITSGPNTAPANPRWRTAAILKKVKSPHLCNRLTDFDEIWQDNAD